MSNSPKKVIVSGVTGQDGSYMVDYLLANTDHLVYGMVRRTSKPDYSNIQQALSNPRFTLVTGDLSDSSSIDELVRQIVPDYFINLACQSFVGASWTLAEMTLDVGAIGVVRILEAVRKHAAHCRVYSAGSSEQWGDVLYSPQDEKHPMRPRSPYGIAKCAAGLACKVWRESYGIYVVHAILTNHESPRRGEEFVTRKITKAAARIARDLKDPGVVGRWPTRLFHALELGNLDARRDWSDSRDFVDGMWKMLNQEKPKEYVLASGETHSVREFVTLAFKEVGLDLEWHGTGVYERATAKGVVSEESGVRITLVCVNPTFYRPAEVDLLHGDSSLARTELGWSPKISFNQMISEMVAADIKALQS